MNSPYIKALNRPVAALPELLRKNDTVIGIIGKTQGVRIIAKPQSMAWSMRDQSKGTFSFTGNEEHDLRFVQMLAGKGLFDYIEFIPTDLINDEDQH